MKVNNLAAALGYAVTSQAISVLLPLYIYPESGAWDPVYNAISGNPSVDFIVVVNPDSGPSGADPGSDYTTAVTHLNSYPNVHSLGYVRTNYTARALSDVQSDIATYASWPASYAVHGIFFDEATNAATAAAESYMSSAASSAHSAFTSGTVIFNPGTLDPAPYFADADLIVEFEDTWADFSAQGTPGTIPQGQRAKSAIIVNSTPAAADLQGAVESANAAGVKAIYFTGDCCYNEVGLVGKVASAVASVS